MKTPRKDLKKHTFLALGDSYTKGEGVVPNESWPFLLKNALSTTKFALHQPRVIAETGWTTEDLTKAIHKENIQDQFDYVSLLIGVNNQYQKKPVDEFRKGFISLLKEAEHYSKKGKSHIFVLSIPDWSVSPFAKDQNRIKISQEIMHFNTVVQDETRNKGVQFIDITALSKLALNKKEYIAEDGLHFSKIMHQLWVSKIIDQLFNVETK